MELIGLKGIKKKRIKCEYLIKPYRLNKILAKGIAATDAGDNGAINIYRDDDGNIRCEAMRYMVVQDSKTFSTIKAAKKWAAKWYKKIN